MPGVCRIGDKALTNHDDHGCPSCPHVCIGPSVTGSANVMVNGKSVLRLGDTGVHQACCGSGVWQIITASSSVFVNGKPLVTLGDMTLHCLESFGKMIEASGDVNVVSDVSFRYACEHVTVPNGDEAFQNYDGRMVIARGTVNEVRKVKLGQKIKKLNEDIESFNNNPVIKLAEVIGSVRKPPIQAPVRPPTPRGR